jgi:amino acid permease
MDRGLPVFLLFREKFLSPSFVILGEAFSFFAISSSLLGVSATLSGALKDVFHGHRWYVGVTELALVVLLPLTIALSWSHLFIRALEVSGGIFLNIIAGILPLAVALRRRSMPALGWVYLAGFSYILAIEFVRIFL